MIQNTILLVSVAIWIRSSNQYEVLRARRLHKEKVLKKQKFVLLLIFAVCVFYSSISAPVFGQTAIEMPDPGLAAAVRGALGLAANDPITDVAILNLTQLTASESNISDLTGLEHATNLTQLFLWSNSIANVSALSGLTSLMTLDLRFNLITDVSPLSGLTSLTTLNLSDNSVTDVNGLSSLTSLITLYLWNNSITNVSPLSGLTDLRELSLGHNSITDISALSSLTNLLYLYLNANLVSDASPLSGLTNLRELSLWKNLVSDVSPLSSLTILTSLWLQYNPLLDTSPLYSLPLSTVDVIVTQYPPWDVNEDGSVDTTDVELVVAALGQRNSISNPILNRRTDVNKSGHVDNADLLLVIEHASGLTTVNVPDAHLAAAVRAALGVGPDIPLLTGVMRQFNAHGCTRQRDKQPHRLRDCGEPDGTKSQRQFHQQY